MRDVPKSTPGSGLGLISSNTSSTQEDLGESTEEDLEYQTFLLSHYNNQVAKNRNARASGVVFYRGASWGISEHHEASSIMGVTRASPEYAVKRVKRVSFAEPCLTSVELTENYIVSRRH